MQCQTTGRGCGNKTQPDFVWTGWLTRPSMQLDSCAAFAGVYVVTFCSGGFTCDVFASLWTFSAGHLSCCPVGHLPCAVITLSALCLPLRKLEMYGQCKVHQRLAWTGAHVCCCYDV